MLQNLANDKTLIAPFRRLFANTKHTLYETTIPGHWSCRFHKFYHLHSHLSCWEKIIGERGFLNFHLTLLIPFVNLDCYAYNPLPQICQSSKTCTENRLCTLSLTAAVFYLCGRGSMREALARMTMTVAGVLHSSLEGDNVFTIPTAAMRPVHGFW